MPVPSKNTNVQAVGFPIGCSVMAKPDPKEAVGFPIGCNVMAKPGPKEAVGFPIGCAIILIKRKMGTGQPLV
ncbi:hypothetical protein CEP52_012774 [Fusarium oligoseptatum]|uniref:Uncharacterized protein n=1 Tax=Fusarium oligoseptatum TaxID=2604345 RepID=A0A428SWW5_9HYPO|nr:hypothetical protein CEP52_012774 [Fusarium oligoseptatum]